jgi:hypothetical protein
MSIGNIKKKKCFCGVKCGWCVGLITLPPSMSRLFRQCWILNISQPCRPILLLYFLLFFLHMQVRNESAKILMNWTKPRDLHWPHELPQIPFVCWPDRFRECVLCLSYYFCLLFVCLFRWNLHLSVHKGVAWL